MRRRRCLALLPALAIAGCGAFPKPPADTRLDLPPGWRFPAPSTQEGEAPLDPAWWRQFADPDLTALVSEALAHNTDIAEAVERVEQARADLDGARANLGPEIDFSNTGGYTRTPGVPPVRFAFTSPELTASWDLDLFGRLRQASRAARATLLSTAATRDAIRLSVASTVASTYITLLALDARLAIVERNLVLRGEFLHTARRRAETGYTSQLELAQAQSEYDSNATLVPATKLAIAQTEDALSLLLGRPSQAIPRPANGLMALRTPAISAGLPAQLLTRRPDVYAAEQALLAADHTLRSARRALLPDVSLTGFLGGSVNQLLPQAELEYLIANGILAPIFDSGRREATIDATRAQRNEAAYAYKATVLTALRDVNDALTAIRQDRDQVDDYTRQAGVQQNTLSLARDRYMAGYAPYFDQIDAERQLLAAELSLAQAQGSLLGAYVSLYAALGGGWQADRLAAIP